MYRYLILVYSESKRNDDMGILTQYYRSPLHFKSYITAILKMAANLKHIGKYFWPLPYD